jgi:hypothetical protein
MREAALERGKPTLEFFETLKSDIEFGFIQVR